MAHWVKVLASRPDNLNDKIIFLNISVIASHYV